MDECTDWEVNDILECLPYTDRNLWESQRLNAFVTAQVNSRKKLQMHDICEFKWEEKTENKNEDDVEISTEDINRLKELSKQWETE